MTQSNHKHLLLMALPFLLGTFFLTIIPVFLTIRMAFTYVSTFSESIAIRFDNFRQVLSAPLIRVSIKNSLLFIAAAVPIRLMAAFGLAQLFNHEGRLFSIFRAGVFIPSVIPPAAYSLIWLWIFNPIFGPLNTILNWIGFHGPNWLATRGSAFASIVIMLAFQIGEGFIVLLAGLQRMSIDLIDSAKIDGADNRQVFRWITVPHMMPWIMVILFRDILFSLQATFTPTFIMTYGGPYYATTFTPLMAYELAFDFNNTGLSSALLVLMYGLMALIVIWILSLLENHFGDVNE